MLDQPPPALSARAAPTPPVAALLVGRTPEDAAALLPRLFNLCRTAQDIAGRMALGLPVPDAADLGREVLRDHLLKLCVTWPGHLGLSSRPPPQGWTEGSDALRRAVFGRAGRPPETGADFEAFLASDDGVAPVLAALAARFAPGEAVADGLPALTRKTAFEAKPAENSVAARHARHPAMQHVEARHGRGPLWRAAARLWDIAACLDATLPAPQAPWPGYALVAAARGLYAVLAKVTDGRVSAFARVTPTDHLLAPGGILDRALASVSPINAALLLDILDPCTPVTLKEAGHA